MQIATYIATFYCKQNLNLVSNILFPEIGETRRASLSAKATGDQLEHMLSLVIEQKVMVKDDDGEPKMAVVRQVDRFKNRFEVLMGGVVRTLHASRIAGRGIYYTIFSSLIMLMSIYLVPSLFVNSFFLKINCGL